MKQYKGIIFNSVNIGLLNGELGRVVSANNIRTAVVSRKTRTECKKFMKSRGISVDVVIGGHDLDTRYKQFGKPDGVPMIIASAMMYLNHSEVAVFGDYYGDRKSCESAGMKYFSKVEKLIPELGVNESRVNDTVDTTGFKVPVTGIIGEQSQQLLLAWKFRRSGPIGV